MSLFRQSEDRIDHQYVEDRISAYIDGDLSPREQKVVDQHLVTCPACQWHLDTIRQTVQWTRELPTLPVPRVFTIPVPAQRVPAPRRRRSFVPLLQGATALIALLLVFTVAGDVLLTGTLPVGAPQPMLQQEQAAFSVDVTREVELVETEVVLEAEKEVVVEAEQVVEKVVEKVIEQMTSEPLPTPLPPAAQPVEEPAAAAAGEEQAPAPAAEEPVAAAMVAPSATVGGEVMTTMGVERQARTADEATAEALEAEAPPEPSTEAVTVEPEVPLEPATEALATATEPVLGMAEGAADQVSEPTPAPLPSAPAAEATAVAAATIVTMDQQPAPPVPQQEQRPARALRQPIVGWIRIAELGLGLALILLVTLTVMAMVRRRRVK